MAMEGYKNDRNIKVDENIDINLESGELNFFLALHQQRHA
jgi:hypothetical protein